jgi:hypothetical protein
MPADTFMPENAGTVNESGGEPVDGGGVEVRPLPSCEVQKFYPLLDDAAYVLGAAEFRMLYCCLMFDHGRGEKALASRRRLWMMIGRSKQEADRLIASLVGLGWLDEFGSYLPVDPEGSSK